MDRFTSIDQIGSGNFSGSNQNIRGGLGVDGLEVVNASGNNLYGDVRQITSRPISASTGYTPIQVDPPPSLNSSGRNVFRPGVDTTPQYIEVDPPPNFQPPRTPTPVTPQDILDISQPINTTGNGGATAPANAVQPFRGGLPANQWRNDPSLGQRLRTDLGGGGSGGSFTPRTGGVNPSVSSSGSFSRGTQAMPRSLPRAIGLGVRAIPPVMAAADFANQVRHGTPVAEAAARSGGGLAGGAVGGSVGAAIGQAVIPVPVVGAAIGGLVGGLVGGVGGTAAADRLYNEALNRFAGVVPLPPSAMIPETNVSLIPFRGGQESGVRYIFDVVIRRDTFTETRVNIVRSGTIIGIQQFTNTFPVFAGQVSYERGFRLIFSGGTRVDSFGSASAMDRVPLYEGSIVNLRRVDGLPDNSGDRYEPAPMVLVPQFYPGHPANSPHADYFPNTADRQTQSGQGNEPIRVPSLRLAPGGTAPLQNAGQVVPTLPELQHTPTPLQANPNWNYGLGIPVARMGGGTMNPLTSPGLTTTPQGINPFPQLQRRTTTTNLRQTEPDRNLGRVPPIFPPTGQTRATSPQPRRRRLRQQTVNRTNMPGTNPCTGCGAAIRQDVQRNNDLLNQLNTGLNAANTLNLDEVLAKLNTINNKLGPQVTGGLSGFLQSFREKFDKFVKWTQIDRVLTVLTFITVVHNAFMLSNQIGQTLMSAISQGLAVIGIRDEDGNELDINSIIGTAVENAIKSIIGEENYTTMSAQWKRANRIYQAASNILFSIQSIMYSVLESLEVIGSYVAKIGNAAKRFGTFAENCYAWMNPNPNFTQNRFFRFLDTTQEVVENIDEVAGEVLSVQEMIPEIGEQSQQLQQAMAGVDEAGQPYPSGFDVPENIPTLTTEVSNNEESQSPPILPEHERTPITVGD
ncbi:MAG: hypothetical protein HC899_25995 [Leptolyngbyaceae cyanobacterium SM1_4_3]|nr:hypothetical protein [Leptolyngbyaceae cyanobacterium SM1_4_3]